MARGVGPKVKLNAWDLEFQICMHVVLAEPGVQEFVSSMRFLASERRLIWRC